MFFPGSRYEHAVPYAVAMPDGTTVAVTRLPLPLRDPIRGLHLRREGQRLDLIAAHFLVDATTFWRLCDANNAVVPDALAVHGLIGIPRKSP